MFVIVGANGNTGRIAAESLLANQQPVRVVVRDGKSEAAWRAKGADVAVGALDDSASLVAAFAGAQGVYLLVPPDNATTDQMGRARDLVGNAAKALAAAKVPHVVLLSSIGAEHASGTGPIASVHIAEEILRDVPGLARTFLRASYFLENHGSVLGAVTGHGILPTFLPADLRFPQIGTADIGRFAAKALVEAPAAGETRIWNLAGATDVSERDIAQALSTLLGKDIAVVENPLDAVVPTFTSFGISEHLAGLYREMYEGIAAGRVVFPAGAEVRRGSEGPREVLARLLG